MSEVEAVAKAVEKTAELGTQTLQTTEKVGGFFARVFQEPIETCVGVLSDRLRVWRLKNWDRMADEVDEILRRRGVENTRAVPPKIGFPLLEHASLEDEPELQRLWSSLLANAMDPASSTDVRTAYTEIIRNLSPLDARLLFLLYRSLPLESCGRIATAKTHAFNEAQIRTALNLSGDEYTLSIDNLLRLRCVAIFSRRLALGNGLKADSGDVFLSAEPRVPSVIITALGIRFVEASSSDETLEDAGIVSSTFVTNSVIDTSMDLRVGNL